jgi:hypothetical protein
VSFYIVVSVLKHSPSKLAKRLVMIALADAAGRDGVTWIGQREIAETAKLSQAHVRECLAELEKDGEIEARKAQVGRRRINVYRVLVPGIEEIDYGRFPFKLSDPFSDDRGISALVAKDDDRGISGATTAESPRPTRAADEEVEPASEPGTLVGSASSGRAPAEKERPRNLPFDALVEVCPGTDPKVDGSLVAKALKDIRLRLYREHEGREPALPAEIRERIGDAYLGDSGIVGGPEEPIVSRKEAPDPKANAALADEIRRRAAAYRSRWPDIDITPTALAKNWTLVVVPKPGGKVSAADVLGSVDLANVGQSSPRGDND